MSACTWTLYIDVSLYLNCLHWCQPTFELFTLMWASTWTLYTDVSQYLTSFWTQSQHLIWCQPIPELFLTTVPALHWCQPILDRFLTTVPAPTGAAAGAAQGGGGRVTTSAAVQAERGAHLQSGGEIVGTLRGCGQLWATPLSGSAGWWRSAGLHGILPTGICLWGFLIFLPAELLSPPLGVCPMAVFDFQSFPFMN